MDNRKRYKCVCSCGNVFFACKSMFQEMGLLENGCGSCPECKVFYNMTFNEESQEMILTPLEEYLKNRSSDNEIKK